MDVFILAAGKGKRMANTLWPEVPKCLLPYKGKAILSHVIDSFLSWNSPPKWLSGPPVFYIAVPVGDSLICSYVRAAYRTTLNVVFVEVQDTGAGPLNSFMELAMFRDTNDPFVVTVSDCVMPLASQSSLPEGNYLGCAKIPDELQTDYLNMVFRLISYTEFVEKARVRPGVESFAWSGLALIADAKEYQQHVSVLLDEHTNPASEVSYAELFSTFRASRRTQSLKMLYQDFLDLGTSDKYNAATKEQNVWAKGDQITYTETATGRVVKYFKDAEQASGFLGRGHKLSEVLYGPKGLIQDHNFVSYARAPGESLRTVGTKQLTDLLNDLYYCLWRSPSDSRWVLLQAHGPKVKPLSLFADKTRERLGQFRTNTGTNIDSWLTLLDDPKWTTFSHTKLGRIHGDLTLDNILYDPVSENYTFIDWRPSTCAEPGSAYGDVYYDLAKLCLSLYIDLAATRELGTGQVVVLADRNLLLVFQAWCSLNTFGDVFDYDTIVRQTVLLMASMAGVHSEPMASGFYDLSLKWAHHIDAGYPL